MDNNQIIPGFDDEQDSHLRIQIDILFDLTLGCFLLSRPSGVINRTNVSVKGTAPRFRALVGGRAGAIGIVFRSRPGSDDAESGPGSPRGYGQAEVL